MMTRSASALGARAPATTRRATAAWVFMAASLAPGRGDGAARKGCRPCEPDRLLAADVAAPPEHPAPAQWSVPQVRHKPTNPRRRACCAPAQAAKSTPPAQLDAR